MDFNVYGPIIAISLPILAFWAVTHSVALEFVKGGGLLFFTPKGIYECTTLNWFGAILLYVLCFLAVPFYAIAAFIVWITHVGRRGSEDD